MNKALCSSRGTGPIVINIVMALIIIDCIKRYYLLNIHQFGLVDLRDVDVVFGRDGEPSLEEEELLLTDLIHRCPSSLRKCCVIFSVQSEAKQ